MRPVVWTPAQNELGFHVLLVERLGRVPVQLQFRGHILNRRSPAAQADMIGKALGVVRIVGQKVELLSFHLATTVAPDTHLQFQIYPSVAARQIAHAAHLAIVPAHLWDEWTDRATGQAFKSCTMIITEPNAFIAKVHDRMPVLLEPPQFEQWLDGSADKEILRPAHEDLLQMWPVSRRVNSSRADHHDPTLIERIELKE
jgi:SOS response associated peptidase (SRAP)